MLKFLFVDYFSGHYIMNAFYNLPARCVYYYRKYLMKKKVEYPEFVKLDTDTFPFGFIKGYSYLQQLKSHIKTLKFEDQIINKNFEEIEKLSENERIEIARKRGISVESHNFGPFMKQIWLNEDLYENLECLLWKQVLRHKYNNFLITFNN